MRGCECERGGVGVRERVSESLNVYFCSVLVLLAQTKQNRVYTVNRHDPY